MNGMRPEFNSRASKCAAQTNHWRSASVSVFLSVKWENSQTRIPDKAVLDVGKATELWQYNKQHKMQTSTF